MDATLPLDAIPSTPALTVRKQKNSYVFLCVGVLFFGMVVSFLIPALMQPFNILLFAGLLAASLISFFLMMFRGIPRVGLRLTDEGIVEETGGRMELIPFENITGFGFIRSNGNYWMRVTIRNPKMTFRYTPIGMTAKKIEPFRELASDVQGAIERYNADQPVDASETTIGNQLVTDSANASIETGLSKGEKATNYLRVAQVVILGLVYLVTLLTSFSSNDHTLGYILLGALACGMVIAAVGNRRSKKSS